LAHWHCFIIPSRHNPYGLKHGRIRDGLTYVKSRNDTLRQHPCLVPYEQLPESEKDYDRHTAIATIQFILQQGFTITKK
jgi:ryanodine receptor 2